MAQMKTPTPHSMVILDEDNRETFTSCRSTSSGKKKLIRREGSTTSLEILPPVDKENNKNNSRSDRKKSSRSSQDGDRSSPLSSRTSCIHPVRPDAGSNRRPTTPGTPTRQVMLQAVKRRQEREEDFGPLELESNDFTVKKSHAHATCHKVNSRVQFDRENLSPTIRDMADDKHEHNDKQAERQPNASADSDEFDTDLEDGSGSSDGAKEKPTAPNELMLEFLDCIYKKEWDAAKNLCRMILIYESDNAEANKFSTLIEEKLRIVAERGSDEETGDEDDSDDAASVEESGDSDDEDLSSQDSSDADSEPEDEDDDNDDVIIPQVKKDSSKGNKL